MTDQTISCIIITSNKENNLITGVSIMTINKKQMKATHCKLLSSNLGTSSEEGHDVFLSKHFNIPYLGVFSDDLKINIDHLKSFEADLPHF